MNYKIISIILILALSALACGFSFSIPQAPTPGPDVTTNITVSAPTSGATRLTIAFGAGDLKLSPGAKDLVDGTATYNVPDLKPVISTQGGDIQIKQGELQNFAYPRQLHNEWDLQLGSAPMDLTVNAGAYNGTYELGGLSLTSLTVKDGAANVKMSFSQPNASEMSLFRYETGASTVKLSELANANFNTMIFNSGAGDYTLDFSGTLKRDATITISSGLSNLILVIPQNVHAIVTTESGLSNVNAGPGWSQSGNVYTQSGSGPTLTFIIKTGAGNLTLTH
ncbi:MAG: toast rack family protein [Chloroflexi bacterium]|nr:toast rack family protein [Chloroflexota bacterium]